jgi:hypothetical protein
MKFIGLRKQLNEKTGEDEIIEYELSLKENNITCYYKDRYGVYVCSSQGKMYKVKHSLDEAVNMLDS